MPLIKWDPFVNIDEVFNLLPSVRGAQSVQNSFVPALDVYEDKDNVIIETPLAGVNPSDVEVSVDKRVLSIKGEHKKEHEVDEKNYYRKEVRSGSFFRQVPLPVSVIEDKVSAQFEDGILKITCPKAKPAKVKKVNVKVVKKSKE